MAFSNAASATTSPQPSREQLALYRKIALRVAPLVMLLYFVAFLDRVNVGFAALTMNRDLGISEAVYGLAAGIFFVGYLLFAVPSNAMLARFGAPRWIAFLMVTWGVVGCGMAFVHGPATYLVLRFLLGAAESGFLPGIVFYLTCWLPNSARAGILALLYLAIPLSSVIGSPISAAILRLNGTHGLAGWQWLFLLEALPAVLLGCAVPWLLEAGPATARWLTGADKVALAESMASEAKADGAPGLGARGRVSVLLPLAATYFTLMIGLYELGFWTPKLLASYGVPLRALGWWNALPYAVGAAVLLPWCRWSDHRNERRWTLAASFTAASFGFAAAALSHNLPSTLAGLSVAAFGVFVSMPVFWAAASQRLGPAAAAFGIAAINSVGNVGGFLGPYATGWLLGRTHSYATGLLATAAALLAGALLVAVSVSDGPDAAARD